MKKTIWVKGAEFVLIEAEKLSLEDEFMKFEPRTDMENSTRELITEAISNGVKNFYRPKYDPSFILGRWGVRYKECEKPAVQSFDWWKKNAKKYCPEHNSRLGTNLEYGAFLGVLIKKLIEEGMSVDVAWNVVCNDSRELGHYLNSRSVYHTFERTGSRRVCDFYDLANTNKLLSGHNCHGYWQASGNCFNKSYEFPIAKLWYNAPAERGNYTTTGWLVLEK